MKTLRLSCTAAVALLAGEFVSRAQGTVNFATRISGTVDARVTYSDGTPVSSEVWGQLYAGEIALGSPVPFRDSPVEGRGYITAGGTVWLLDGVPGETAQVRLVAWHTGLGPAYAEARTRSAAFEGVGVGESAPTSVRLGGGVLLVPGNLVGLQGFAVPAVSDSVLSEWQRLYGPAGGLPGQIPEPGPAALFLVGGVVWFGFRRDRR
ncbi:MAG: PEP-CTERM sorting domain-containing protein [Verrucomicrobiales bacterium]|nr:PEP-CTERM sorting domain-containing protein [Verrucomicrobiales bacterium]